MRYSRLKRSRSRRRYISMFIVVALLFGGIYFLSAGAVGRYISKIVGPILARDQKSDKIEENGDLHEYEGQNRQEEVELTLPESQKDSEVDQETKDGRITEDIKIEPVDYYAIQVGAFNGIDNAELLALDVKRKGGAGYIIEDEYFRVIAMAYATESDALLVKDQLKEQGVESQIYKLICSGVNMEITAAKEKIEGIKLSFSTWNEKISSLESIVSELDMNKITSEMSINKLREIREDFEGNYNKIEEYIEVNKGNKILEGLQKLYKGQIDNLDQILQKNVNDRVAISSSMKYNYIDMIYQFNKYIQEITKA